MIVEGSHFENDPAVFSVFNVIFETVSGKCWLQIVSLKLAIY
jgi:hypothetical protein